jgi:hypothetical protein
MFTFFFPSLHYCLLRSFTFENKRSAVGFLTQKTQNTPIFFNSEILHIVGTVWNTSD